MGQGLIQDHWSSLQFEQQHVVCMKFIVTQDGPVCSLSRVIDALGGAVEHVASAGLRRLAPCLAALPHGFQHILLNISVFSFGHKTVKDLAQPGRSTPIQSSGQQNKQSQIHGFKQSRPSKPSKQSKTSQAKQAKQSQAKRNKAKQSSKAKQRQAKPSKASLGL